MLSLIVSLILNSIPDPPPTEPPLNAPGCNFGSAEVRRGTTRVLEMGSRGNWNEYSIHFNSDLCKCVKDLISCRTTYFLCVVNNIDIYKNTILMHIMNNKTMIFHLPKYSISAIIQYTSIATCVNFKDLFTLE